MNRYICIHGHFYQPPRENPWLEEVELQDSAYPCHDWNERVTLECYAPNAASRILDPSRRIVDIVNNYSTISANFGPTLLSWMEAHAPDTYEKILAADRQSQKRFAGHGSAIAQPYNHQIMPLASSRDKRTQVIWGIRDFAHRFERRPEGMWLPETAVDLETLDIMAQQGILFTILAPHQAGRARRIGRYRWKDVRDGQVDPRRPYLCRLPSGRRIVLFFYDAPAARDVAFGGLLDNGEDFARRLLGLFSDDQEGNQLVHIATDGETYGHHRHSGEMALAYCTYAIERSNLARLTVYGEYLEKHPPTHEVAIIENSSWSCIHGLERWRSHCGCNSGMHHGWKQEWRAPLRGAMDWLRDTLSRIYEEEAGPYLTDPWEARDDYIGVLLGRSPEHLEEFLLAHSRRELSREEKVKLLKLLEMQRHAMLMYTSCGWFFDEISGSETVQVIQYAARAMQLAKDLQGIPLIEGYVKILERAPSNIPEFRNGARVFERFVTPAVIDLPRVGAHYAVSSIFEKPPEAIAIYSYSARRDFLDAMEAGQRKLVVGTVNLRSEITLEEMPISFAVVHLGGHSLNGGVTEHSGDEPFAEMHDQMRDSFERGDLPELLRLMGKHFGTRNYSLKDLFKDHQRRIVDQILDSTLAEVEAHFQQIHQHHYPDMQLLAEMGIPLPKIFSSTLEYLLNRELMRLLREEDLDLDRLDKIVGEVRKWTVELDERALSLAASQKLTGLLRKLSQAPREPSLLPVINTSLEILRGLPLSIDMREAQNSYFTIGQQEYDRTSKEAESGSDLARQWVDSFHALGEHLGVRMP